MSGVVPKPLLELDDYNYVSKNKWVITYEFDFTEDNQFCKLWKIFWGVIPEPFDSVSALFDWSYSKPYLSAEKVVHLSECTKILKVIYADDYVSGVYHWGHTFSYVGISAIRR